MGDGIKQFCKTPAYAFDFLSLERVLLGTDKGKSEKNLKPRKAKVIQKLNQWQLGGPRMKNTPLCLWIKKARNLTRPTER